jgi:hypothetical protein
MDVNCGDKPVCPWIALLPFGAEKQGILAFFGRGAALFSVKAI